MALKVRLQTIILKVPQDNSNLAYRAAQLMTQQFPDAYARFGVWKFP
jgi:4-diphosphocytidyl-2C-methyl-D-erythritol kinase